MTTRISWKWFSFAFMGRFVEQIVAPLPQIGEEIAAAPAPATRYVATPDVTHTAPMTEYVTPAFRSTCFSGRQCGTRACYHMRNALPTARGLASSTCCQQQDSNSSDRELDTIENSTPARGVTNEALASLTVDMASTRGVSSETRRQSPRPTTDQRSWTRTTVSCCGPAAGPSAKVKGFRPLGDMTGHGRTRHLLILRHCLKVSLNNNKTRRETQGLCLGGLFLRVVLSAWPGERPVRTEVKATLRPKHEDWDFFKFQFFFFFLKFEKIGSLCLFDLFFFLMFFFVFCFLRFCFFFCSFFSFCFSFFLFFFFFIKFFFFFLFISYIFLSFSSNFCSIFQCVPVSCLMFLFSFNF